MFRCNFNIKTKFLFAVYELLDLQKTQEVMLETNFNSKPQMAKVLIFYALKFGRLLKVLKYRAQKQLRFNNHLKAK
jgi:hypothetical protein